MSAGGLVAITSRWLLLALVLDLSITRLSLRIAIFLPKGAVVADVVGAFARVGAVVENVLVLVALVALGALFAESGGRAGSAWKAGLVLTAGVAIGGLLSHWQAPSPVVSAALGALTVGAALLLAVPAVRAAARDPYAVAILALAGAASLPALAALGGAGAAASGAASAPGLGLALTTVGGVVFLIGVVLASALGVRAIVRPGGPGIAAVGARWVAAGFAIGLALGLAALAAPQTAGLLLIWGLGLPSMFLLPLYGVGAAIAIVGLRGAWLFRPRLAAGVAVVALAGYGLASSGLVLAGLIGIALAAEALEEADASPAATRRQAALPVHG